MKTSRDLCILLVFGLFLNVAYSNSEGIYFPPACNPFTIETKKVVCTKVGCILPPSGDVIASITDIKPFPAGQCILGGDLIPTLVEPAVACSAIVTSCKSVPCCNCIGYGLS